VKALFIGLGGIGQRHLRILKSLEPDVQIAAVRSRGRPFEIGDDLQPNTSVNIDEKYNISVFSSIADAAQFAPDFAIVANPTSLHVQTAMDLVEQNIPLLLEKPVSNTSEQLGALLDAAKSHDSIVMVGYMMRFHPCAEKMKQYIEQKALGDIYSVSVNVNSYMPAWHKYEKYNEFYAGKKDLGGGVVLTEIHELDLLNWYFGAPGSVSAIGGKLSPLALDVEDTVAVMLEQPCQGRHIPVTVNMSFVQQAPIREFLVLGENGSIRWDIVAQKIVLDEYKNDTHELHEFAHFERNEMFRLQMQTFINSVKSKEQPFTALEQVIDGHLTALAIKASLQSNAKVDFADFKNNTL